MNFVRRLANKLSAFLGWIEIRPRRTFTALAAFKHYLTDLNEFSSRTNWKVLKYPCLFDLNQEAGSCGEYFFQDIYVAKRIIEQNPGRHIDVGSRVDGFIAHLACVRRVEVLDIRPMISTVNEIDFHQADITGISADWFDAADCLSCLHALEHFGLNRYGDGIDPDGWQAGFQNLQRILKKGGVLWLSVPVGKQRVEFNAHRVFDPQTIYNFASGLGLTLQEFAYLDKGKITVSSDHENDFRHLASANYNLGIFKFTKG